MKYTLLTRDEKKYIFCNFFSKKYSIINIVFIWEDWNLKKGWFLFLNFNYNIIFEYLSILWLQRTCFKKSIDFGKSNLHILMQKKITKKKKLKKKKNNISIILLWKIFFTLNINFGISQHSNQSILSSFYKKKTKKEKIFFFFFFFIFPNLRVSN